MKKVLLLFLILNPIVTFSQSEGITGKLTEYLENKMCKIDSNKVTVSFVLDNITDSKSNTYIKVKDYITEFYSDHNSVLTIDNPVDGVLEVESVHFSFFSYIAETTIPVNYHVFYTLRVALGDNKLHITCFAKEWIAEWSTIGSGYKAERNSIIDCIPLGEKKVFNDENETANAFFALVDTMHASIGALEKVILNTEKTHDSPNRTINSK